MSISLRTPVSVLAIFVMATTVGCLSSPDDVKFVRHFRPLLTTPTVAPEVKSLRPPVALRRVFAAGHLQQPIAWVRDGIEIGQYDDLRWYETPQRIVERALDDVMYREYSMSRALVGDQLEVEVTGFEQILGTPSHARVELRLVIEGRSGSTRESFHHEIAVKDESPEALAIAMGEALSVTVRAAADWVQRNRMD